MAKSKKKLTKKDVQDLNVQEASIDELLAQQISIYAKELILDRAVPFLEDGLKPVQRRTLYTAYINNVLSNKKHMKCAKLAGLVLGFHPHAPASIEDVLTNLSADWKYNIPLIDINGNNGAITGDGAASSRYIEGRLTKEAELLLDGLNKNCVEMERNFDNTEDEPVLLPAKWPVSIINGTSGIAYGMKTDILPHNPDEIMDALIKIAENPKVKDEELMNIIKGPDFPTGGCIIKDSASKDEFLTGKAKFINRGKAEIDFKHKQIKITEIPYGMSTTNLVANIASVLEQYTDVLKISELSDETTTEPHIVINFTKKATEENMQTALNLLYKKSKLEMSQFANMLMIVDGKPQQIGIRTYLEKYLEFHKKITRNEFQYDYDILDKRLNIVYGLLKLIDISDEVIKLAKKCDGKTDLVNKLIEKYDFNEPQAEAIAKMPIYNLGRQNALSLKKEKEEKEKEANRLKQLLDDEKLFNKEIVKILKETKSILGEHPRKTQIISADKTEVQDLELDQKQLIKEQSVLVVIKTDGVIQRMSEKVFDNNIKNYDNKDKIIETINAKTTNGMLFFTKNGLSFYRVVNDIENLTLKQDADSIQKTIDDYKSNDEILTACIYDDNQKPKEYIVSVTNKGNIKVGRISDLIPSTKTKLYIKKAKKYNGLKIEDDFVEKVFLLTEDELNSKSIVFVRSDGKELDYPLKDLTIQGAGGSGANKGKLGKSFEYKDSFIK